MTYYYFFSHIAKPLTTGYEIVLTMDIYCSLVMRGFDSLVKSNDYVYVNSGYYCFNSKAISPQFANAYGNKKLFEYVGQWETNSTAILENSNVNFNFYGKSEGEDVSWVPGSALYFHPVKLKDLFGWDNEIHFKRKFKEGLKLNQKIQRPQTIPKKQFLRNYYVFTEKYRPDILKLVPAFEDWDITNDHHYSFGLVVKPPANPLKGSVIYGACNGNKTIAEIANESGEDFLGLFCGPDIFQLAEWGVPCRIRGEHNALGGYDTAHISVLEFIFPLKGLKIPPLNYPKPKQVTINQNNLRDMNYFLEGICLYKIGMSIIEGYKFSWNSNRALIFDNGFKIMDIQNRFIDRNICDFGSSLTYIRNEWKAVQKERKTQLAVQLLSNTINSIIMSGVGIGVGSKLIGLGAKQISLAKQEKFQANSQYSEEQVFSGDYNNAEMDYYIASEPVTSEEETPTQRRRYAMWEAEEPLIKAKQEQRQRSLDRQATKATWTYERSKQIGESQKLSGLSTAMYSTASPFTTLIGNSGNIVEFLNSRTLSPTTVSGGGNFATQNGLALWTQYYNENAFTSTVVNYHTQDFMKYTPKVEYIIQKNLDLLDNGISIGLPLKIKDLLVDNPNLVLNISGASITKLFYKYFEYLPLEYELEIINFFKGTFVYWTERYPEHRGQEFKLIK